MYSTFCLPDPYRGNSIDRVRVNVLLSKALHETHILIQQSLQIT